MKSKIILFMLLSAFNLPSHMVLADTAFVDVVDAPAPKGRNPSGILLADVELAGTRIVGVGQRGHIIYSDNLGKNWTQASVPVSSDLVAVNFPTKRMGWAVGHDGVVLHTEDAGVTWVKQLDGRAAAQVMADTYMGKGASSNVKPESADMINFVDEIKMFVDQGADKPFLDVWFENETTGFIVGAFNLIFRTTDGGKSWIPWYDRIDNPQRLHLYSISQVGNEIYLTGEQGTVFKLDRQQKRFRAIKTPYEGTFFGITGKPGALLAFGMRGNVFLSPDGGKSWRKVETGVQSGLMGATVTVEGKIVLVSQGGQILISSDDGVSFRPAKNNLPFPIAAVAALDKNTLAMVGQRGVQIQFLKE